MAQDSDLFGSASMDEDKENKKKKKAVKKEKATKKSSGGAEAATITSLVAGPIAGAAVGIGGSLIDANRADKAAGKDPNRPKRRKLAKGVEAFSEAKKKRENAMSALSTAVFDFSKNLR